MPSDLSMRIMNGVHRAAMKLSGGRLGWNLGGMPVVELTTIGRKSGERRSTMLTAPLVIDGSPVVVASRGGDDVHPAWYLNLRDEPRVDVVLNGAASRPMTAHIATAEERATMWPDVVAKYPHYAGYQKKTDREIPLVVLRPRA